jgi:hypothetical protein
MILKKTGIAMIIAFILCIAGISVISLVMEDREFSPNENRYLAEAPKLTVDNLMSGKFQDDLEDYLRDQICFRDGWITVKTAIQKACGNTDIGGAYVGSDGYDFEKITPEDVDDKLVARNIRAVSDYFSDTADLIGADKLSFLLVPTSGLVMADKLPENARLFDQSAYIEQVQDSMEDYNFIDVQQTLIDNKDEYIYYRTDHHWTSAGAYLAYEKWCESTGRSCADIDSLTENTVTEKFRGSLYSKILDADSAYDSIWTYGDLDAPILIDNDEIKDSIYDESKLSEKDKYAYFFGGNYGEIYVDGTGEGNLLVVKDSFANSFVPMLTQNYDTIYMVDLRYYNGDMTEYITEHGITEVLVLYNISNFISDRNIYKLASGITKKG